MTTILCDALPFCYGPAAALSGLGKALAKRGYSMIAVAGGTTAEILKDEAVFEIIPCGESTEDRIQATRCALSRADLYLNVVAPDTYGHIHQEDIPKVYVDFLFWMFSPQFAGREIEADLYLIENYPGSREQIDAYGHLLKSPMLIPPLVSTPECPKTAANGKRLVVCFGGLESPLTRVGINTNYPYIMTPLILRAIEQISFDEVLFTGEGQTMKRLQELYGRANILFKHLPHHCFLDELNRASILLTHPGLYAPFEGFSQGVPTLFLPSSNYTQVLQLRFYSRAGVAWWSNDWEDLGITPKSGPIPAGLPEQKGVAQVLECIRLAEANAGVCQRLEKSFAEALSQSLANPAPVIESQRHFFRSLAWTSGTEMAAEAVARLFERTGDLDVPEERPDPGQAVDNQDTSI